MDLCLWNGELSNSEFLAAFHRKADGAGIPLAAVVELTERCNLRCSHCLLGDQSSLHRRREHEVATAEWIDILDQMAALGTLRLLITGGEPLLRPDFPAIYRHAKELGLLVTVFTNATLAKPEIVELFRELPPYAVEVSLYGATASTYEAVTGVPGSFERCVAGIEQLRQSGVELGIKTVVLTTNRHEVAQIAELARSWGTLQFRLDTEIQAAFGGDLGPLSVRLEPEEAARVEIDCPESASGLRQFLERRQGIRLDPFEQLYACGAARSTFTVSPYGRIQPCVAARHISCDLRGTTVAAALAAVRTTLAKRRAPLDFLCNQCQDRSTCGACPAFALVEHGTEERPAEFQCRLTRERRRLAALEVRPKENAHE